MTSDISAVDLNRPLQDQALRLPRKRFPDLVGEDKCRLVGKPRASRELQSRYASGADYEDGDNAARAATLAFSSSSIRAGLCLSMRLARRADALASKRRQIA